MSDVHLRCDVCGRIGTVDDGISGDRDDCPDEECEGTVHSLARLAAIENIGVVQQMVRRLRTLTHSGDLDDAVAIDKGAKALAALAKLYEANHLWEVGYSSGADDAAGLYRVMEAIGLEVP
jgi:hypothetical protein